MYASSSHNRKSVLDGLYQMLHHTIALKPGRGGKLMCDAIILTNLSKFLHPLTPLYVKIYLGISYLQIISSFRNLTTMQTSCSLTSRVSHYLK
jgi:hypothetical protein